MKIKCTKQEQAWLCALISEQCRGGYEDCNKYETCEECIINDKNYEWEITDSN